MFFVEYGSLSRLLYNSNPDMRSYVICFSFQDIFFVEVSAPSPGYASETDLTALLAALEADSLGKASA